MTSSSGVDPLYEVEILQVIVNVSFSTTDILAGKLHLSSVKSKENKYYDLTGYRHWLILHNMLVSS